MIIEKKQNELFYIAKRMGKTTRKTFVRIPTKTNKNGWIEGSCLYCVSREDAILFPSAEQAQTVIDNLGVKGCVLKSVNIKDFYQSNRCMFQERSYFGVDCYVRKLAVNQLF